MLEDQSLRTEAGVTSMKKIRSMFLGSKVLTQKVLYFQIAMEK